MKILITGASGFIGKNIVDKLKNKEYKLVLAQRKKSSEHEFVQCDFSINNSCEFWKKHLKDIDIVINSIGIISETKNQKFTDIHTRAPIALFEACKKIDVKKIIQISALGADEKAITPYHKSKKEADDYLRNLNCQSYILKPSIVYGENGVSTELFKGLSALPITPIINDGEQCLQPIYIDDLVQTVLKCITDQKAENKELDLVGPKKVTYKELLANFTQWLEKNPKKTISMPKSFSIFGKFFNEPAISKDNMIMLEQGNCADNKPLELFLGKKLQSMQESIFLTKATKADKLFASFYFLPVMLQFTLAFIWIWSGVVSGFLYPHESAILLLNEVGVSGKLEEPMLYFAALLDILIGILILFKWQYKKLLLFQFLVIIVYTLILSFFAPYHWLHPFGPLSKNLALLLLIYIMILTEKIR